MLLPCLQSSIDEVERNPPHPPNSQTPALDPPADDGGLGKRARSVALKKRAR